MAEHVVETSYDGDDRAYWQCSCGRSGSCSASAVGARSDKHIREKDGRRIDRNRGEL